MMIIPQNYHEGNPAQRTIHQTRVDFINGTVTNTTSFGSTPPTCQYNLALTEPKTESFIGEVYISKYPYHPDASFVGDPGDAIAPGFA